VHLHSPCRRLLTETNLILISMWYSSSSCLPCICFVCCRKNDLARPWYDATKSLAENDRTKKAFKSVLSITLKKPNNQQYIQFSKEVKEKAKEEFPNVQYAEEEVVWCNQLLPYTLLILYLCSKILILIVSSIRYINFKIIKHLTRFDNNTYHSKNYSILQYITLYYSVLQCIIMYYSISLVVT